MRKLLSRRIIIRVCLILPFLLGGCESFKYYETVAVAERPAASPLAHVELFLRGSPVTRPYRVLGKVTAVKQGGLPGTSADLGLRRAAANLGADALIGVYEGEGLEPWFGAVKPYSFRSGLAVKWISDGSQPQESPSVNFIAAVLPIPQGSTLAEKDRKMLQDLYTWFQYPLEVKGYYVLPLDTVQYSGHLDDARLLDANRLREIGGALSQVLVEARIMDSREYNVAVAAGADVKVRVSLLAKDSRTIIFERESKGQYDGSLFNPFTGILATAEFVAIQEAGPDTKRKAAIISAVPTMLQDLPSIQHEVKP